MHDHAYLPQCRAAEGRHQPQRDQEHPRHPGEKRTALVVLALALDTFAIGAGEFGSNGVVQLFATDLGVTVPVATNAVSAYALGVVVGSPVLTVAAARLNRRTLLLALAGLFIAGNLLSAAAADLGMLAMARFLTGTVQGAYFGAGAVVAAYAYGPGKGGKAFAAVMTGLTVATIFGSPIGTFIGQHAGWQALYVAVAGIGLAAGAAIWFWVPCTSSLDGGSIRQELGALRRPMVWVTMAVAALGISSIFAVYTFIGPYITDAADTDAGLIPVALAVFGTGMAVGNWVGGRVADRYEYRGLVLGYTLVLGCLVLIAVGGEQVLVLFPALCGVGATMMLAIPTIQVLLTRYAPEAPTLMGAMNLAALNLANVLGAVGGAVAISVGWGALSTAWVGLALTSSGLLLFGLTVARVAPPQALNALSVPA